MSEIHDSQDEMLAMVHRDVARARGRAEENGAEPDPRATAAGAVVPMLGMGFLAVLGMAILLAMGGGLALQLMLTIAAATVCLTGFLAAQYVIARVFFPSLLAVRPEPPPPPEL